MSMGLEYWSDRTVVSLLNQTVSVILSKLPQNLVVQARHVTSLLYHFRNKKLPLVMRPNHSHYLFLFLLPQTGTTALMWASENGYDNVVEKLLVAGADHDHHDIVRNLVTRVMLIHVLSASVSNKVLVKTHYGC